MANQQKKTKKPKRFEYRVGVADDNEAKIAETLNEYGGEGWRLHSCVVVGHDKRMSGRYFVKVPTIMVVMEREVS